MRQVIWLAIMPLTAFWIYSVGIYSSLTDFNLALASILIGLFILIGSLLKEEVSIYRNFAIAAIPAGITSILVPYPYNIGLIMIVFAFFIYFFKPGLKAVWLGMLFGGMIMSIQAFALSIYYILAPSFHSLNWLSALFAVLFNILGITAASKDGIIFIYGLEATFPFTVTAEKLGIYPLFLILVGAIFLVSISANSCIDALKGVFKLLLISFFYIIIRYVILVGNFFSTDIPQYSSTKLNMFVDSSWLLISFLPLIILFYWQYPIGNLKIDFRLNINKKLSLLFISLLFSSFLFASAFIFHDPGVEKNGRVLVDEIHSVWEFSTLKLDDRWYGESSTYNAYSMVEWLKDNYDVDRIVSSSYINWSVPGATKVIPDLISDKITYDILKNYDILIIKTPSRFEPEEVYAIIRFVEDGGGLLLIGDHTNFAGSGVNLNQIAKRFGIEFGFDAVNTQEGRLYYYNRGLLPHPCIKYMPFLDFMTGCSIKAPVDAEPIILGFGLEATPGEFPSTGFFRETRQNDPTQITDTSWGLFYQAVALNYGKGRVIAFPDSTIISNFRFFFGGTSNLFAGVMEYLNHRNSFDHEKLMLFILGLIGCILAIFIARSESIGSERRLAILVIILLICALSISFSIFMFSISPGDSIPNSFYNKSHTVSFDGAHSAQIVSKGNSQGDYETFFVWTQRLGLTPVVEYNFDKALEKGKFLVIVDPAKPFSVQERQALLKYVEGGNFALLLVNQKEDGFDISKLFNLTTYLLSQPGAMENSDVAFNNSMGLPISPWGLNIKGGNPLLKIGDRIVLTEVNYGDGKFILFADSQTFKDGLYGKPGYMGYSGSNAGSMSNLGYNISNLYKLEYSLFRATDVSSEAANYTKHSIK